MNHCNSISISTTLAFIIITRFNVNASSLSCEIEGLQAHCEVQSNVKVRNESIDFKFLTIANLMSAEIPEEFDENFDNLESFRVTKSKLKEISRKSLKQFINIQHLSLDSNKIEIIFENSFHDLTNLHSIFISNNKIDFLHPNLFVKCIKLKYIWVDYNKIQRLDGRLFDGNPEIEWISFSHNNLKQIDVDFRIFVNLLYVNLEKNEGNCNLIFDKAVDDDKNDFQMKVNEFCRFE